LKETRGGYFSAFAASRAPFSISWVETSFTWVLIDQVLPNRSSLRHWWRV